MKKPTTIRTGMLMGLLLMLFALPGCLKKGEESITIREDGKVDLVCAVTVVRSLFEGQMKEITRSRFQGQDETAGAPKDTKKETDEEKQKQLKEQLENVLNTDLQNTGGGAVLTVTKLELRAEEVDIEVRATVDNFKEFIGRRFYTILSSYTLLDKNAPGELVLRTGKLAKSKAPASKSVEQFSHNTISVEQSAKQMAAQKTKYKISYTFPGEIVKTSLPNREGNRTWAELDCADEAAAMQAAKLAVEGFEIIAKTGKLDLSMLPLTPESVAKEILNRSKVARLGPAHKLPLDTSAEGQIVVMPVSSQTRRFAYLPGGRELMGQFGQHMDNRSRCTVQTELTPVEGIKILQVLKMEPLEGKDDHGRPLKPAEVHHFFSEFTNDRQSPIRAQLDFELPPSDTRTLESIRGKGEVVIFTQWQNLPPMTPEKGKVYDLAALLPGAKLTLTQFSVNSQSNGSQVTVEGGYTLSGPEGIFFIKIRPVFPDKPKVNSSGFNNGNDLSGSGDKCTRTGAFNQHFFFNRDKPSGTPVLEVSLPQGLKRVAFTFDLEGVDLY